MQDCVWFSNNYIEGCEGQCFANLPTVPEANPMEFLAPLVNGVEPLTRCTILSGLVYALQVDFSGASRRLLDQVRMFAVQAQ